MKFQQFESLYGRLRWMFTAINAGPSLLLSLHRNMYSRTIKDNTQYIRVIRDFYDDTFLIELVLTKMNDGIEYEWLLNIATFDVDIFVDASLTGLGGWSNTGYYFTYDYTKDIVKLTKNEEIDIQFLEMAAILIAVESMGDRIAGKNVNIWTDNQPVEWNVRKWKVHPKRGDKLVLLKHISSKLIINNIKLKINGIRTDVNVGADILSRCSPLATKNCKIQDFMQFYAQKFPNKSPPKQLYCNEYAQTAISYHTAKSNQSKSHLYKFYSDFKTCLHTKTTFSVI